MARLPKVKLRAIPVFPSNVTGGNAIDVHKANGSYSIDFNVSNIHVGAVATADTPTTYAVSWGQVTTDNPAGTFQLVPYSTLQPAITPGALSKTNDTNVTLTLGGTPATALLQATSITLGWTGTLAASRGGTGISSLGTGVATALGINVGLAGAFVTFNGAIGTPSSGTATNLTGLPLSTGITGAGTGVLTALGVNTGTAGSVVVNGGALGTPSSGVATNLTGTASGLTAGNVTTNANLTGAVTSVGNAAVLGSFTSLNLKTALTDETGSGAAVFATSPALVTPTGIVKSDVGLGNVDNTSDTTKNAAAVTLTNKTLDGATLATRLVKGTFLLGASAVAAPLTGTLTETTLATITVPANAMGTNGVVRIWYNFSTTNSANTKTLRVRFSGIGGTQVTQQGVTATAYTSGVAQMANRNAANSQVFGNFASAGGLGITTTAAVTAAVDTTSSQTLVITGQLTNVGETITLESYHVELLAPN